MISLLEYAERVSPVKLTDWQKEYLKTYEESVRNGKRMAYTPPKRNGKQMLMYIIERYKADNPDFRKMC